MARAIFATFALLCGLLCDLTLFGQETAAPGQAFKVRLEKLRVHSSIDQYRLYAFGDTGKFAFRIPVGMRYKGVAGGRIRLSSLEGNCVITFSILDPSPRDLQPLDLETYSALAQSRHPEGRLMEQYYPGAAGRMGLGFDIQWQSTNHFRQCTRTAFIPTFAGTLEFDATSAPKDFGKMRFQLNDIMASFVAVGPDENLEASKATEEDGKRSTF